MTFSIFGYIPIKHIKMKRILLSIVLSIYFLSGFSQELTQNRIQEIIQEYSSQIENVMVIKDCGYVLDGPAYIIKQTENRSLDFLNRMSPQERKKVGYSIFNDMKKSKKIVLNHHLENEVVTILRNLMKGLKNNNTAFKLSILQDEKPNAFTTMGGYIYVTTGLLDFVDSYDELAFIIGHEIAHEKKLHTQRKITKILTFNKVLNIPNTNDFKKMVLNINTKVSAPFDQIDEYEADKYGFELAKNAGYDVDKFGDFFEKLAKYEEINLLNKIKSTHPFSEHRKKCLSNY